jgi:hypothetical protein
VILPTNLAALSAKPAKACVEKTQDKANAERNNFFIISSFFNELTKRYFLKTPFIPSWNKFSWTIYPYPHLKSKDLITKGRSLSLASTDFVDDFQNAF